MYYLPSTILDSSIICMHRTYHIMVLGGINIHVILADVFIYEHIHTFYAYSRQMQNLICTNFLTTLIRSENNNNTNCMSYCGINVICIKTWWTWFWINAILILLSSRNLVCTYFTSFPFVSEWSKEKVIF